MDNIQEKINKLIVKYYTEYYKDELGLPDYHERIQRRLREENNFADINIENIEKIANFNFDNSKKILVVGGGTGAEFVQLSKKGCNVYTIEPNDEAIKIMKTKCKMSGFDSNKVQKGFAEKLNFADNEFDFVYCFTVIEHVQDVEKSIKEMIRVTKRDGLIYINTPDYRQLYEAHYKLNIPMFLPKWIVKLILFLKGRPTKFLDTLKFVNAKQLKKIFKNSNVISTRTFFPYKKNTKNLLIWNRLINWMQDDMEIETNQFWILIKQ